MIKLTVLKKLLVNDTTGERFDIDKDVPKVNHLDKVKFEIFFRNDGEPTKVDFDFQVYGNDTGMIGGRPRTTTMFNSIHGGVIPSGKEAYGCHFLDMWSENITINWWLMVQNEAVLHGAFGVGLVTPAPPSATHCLICRYIRLPWFDPDGLRGCTDKIANVVNPFVVPLGYEYIETEVDTTVDTINIYYKKSGSPVLPVGAILTALFWLTVFVIVGIIVIQVKEILVRPIQEQAKVFIEETRFREKIADMIKSGELTQSEAESVLSDYESKVGLPTTEYGELLKMAIFGGIAIALIYFGSKAVEKV